MTTFVFDLDGVIYLGDQAVAGADEVLATLALAGHQILFATNNSYRTVGMIADKILRLTGYQSEPESDVVTSAMAAAAVAADLGVRRPYVLGGPGIAEAVAGHGGDVSETEIDADGVIVGITYDLSYDSIEAAMNVVRAGHPFVAANRDPAYPVADRLRPGAGSIVAAVAAASEREPIAAGKPEQPMIDLLRSRIRGEEVIVVGDRPDTDLVLGKRAGWRTVGVASGVVGALDDIPHQWRPDAFIGDVGELPMLLRGRAWTAAAG